MTNAESSPTILLVHGAWHGSWCWEKLQAELSAAGWHSQTVDLPSATAVGTPRRGVHDDARVVRERLDAIDGPVLLVAHSYGGVPVTEGASGAANVRHIIYLTAFPLDEGESLLGFVGGEPPAWWNIDGDTMMPDEPHDTFYHDIPFEEADLVASRILPFSVSGVTETVRSVAWREIPSTYIVCEQDHAVPVARQEALASRTGRSLRINTSHSPFLSRPAELAALIRGVADEVAR